MEIYAPDTNFFLQCAAPDQLDWKLVTQSDDIVLLVVREVRKELDRLKSGGNARRSKRARAASGLLKRFTTEAVNEIELRAKDPRVLVRSASRPASSAMPDEYRIDSSDERVVAEVYAADSAIEERLTFLSHDTVPLEDAAELGLRTQVIPDEWLLEPEPNDLERQLSEVKRRMTALEGRAPAVVVKVPTNKDGQVVLTTPYFPMLSDGFIERALQAVGDKYRVASKSRTDLINIGAAIAALEGIDEKRWAKYVEEHEQWLAEVRTLLHDASSFFTEDPNAAKLVLEISNRGAAGADNLIIKIEALGDFHLVDPDSLEEEDSDPETYFPTPPAKPRPSVIEGLMGLQRSSYGLPGFHRSLQVPRFHTPAMARDRHAIYWDYESDRSARYAEGQCRDFRHGLQPEEVVLLIERTAIGEDTVSGALQVLVSAGNLVEPCRTTYPVRIESELMDTEQFMRDLLQRELVVVV